MNELSSNLLNGCPVSAIASSICQLLLMEVPKGGNKAPRRANPDSAQSIDGNIGNKRRRTRNEGNQQQNPQQTEFPPVVLAAHHSQPPHQLLNQGHSTGAFPFVDPQQQQQLTPQPLGTPARVSVTYTKPFPMLEQQQPQRTQNLQQGDEAAIMERVRQRQLAELAAMESARPIPDDLQYCAPYNAYGLTSIGWLLMGWREQMVISSLIGVVIQSGPMGGDKAKFKGRKLILQFDKDASQLLTVKEWERDDGRPSELARAQARDRVHLQRLNVVQQKGAIATTNENTFIFTLTFGQFSTMTIISHAGNEWAANATVPHNFFGVVSNRADGTGSANVQQQQSQQHQQGTSVALHARVGLNEEEEEDDEDLLLCIENGQELSGGDRHQPHQRTSTPSAGPLASGHIMVGPDACDLMSPGPPASGHFMFRSHASDQMSPGPLASDHTRMIRCRLDPPRAVTLCADHTRVIICRLGRSRAVTLCSGRTRVNLLTVSLASGLFMVGPHASDHLSAGPPASDHTRVIRCRLDPPRAVTLSADHTRLIICLLGRSRAVTLCSGRTRVNLLTVSLASGLFMVGRTRVIVCRASERSLYVGVVRV
ncbi:hypothetical protein niasHS_000048 [Heterodera schachtii]|uniref:Uncharacterized protein n=1 Tax=Heterodera schachtii TaxID=97005 RepID=A0ABD2K6F4_HETSC